MLTPENAMALGYWFAGFAVLLFAAVLAWLAWETGRDDKTKGGGA